MQTSVRSPQALHGQLERTLAFFLLTRICRGGVAPSDEDVARADADPKQRVPSRPPVSQPCAAVSRRSLHVPSGACAQGSLYVHVYKHVARDLHHLSGRSMDQWTRE